MSENTTCIRTGAEQVVTRADPEDEAAIRRRGWRERGMVTIEYAIGAVLVLVMVGLIIASIKQGWFDSLVKTLITTLLQQIPMLLGGAG